MSNDDTEDRAAQEALQEPHQPDGFNAEPWQVLIGIRGASDPARPSNMTEGLLIGMAATPEAMTMGPQGLVSDKTLEAVHFAQWFDRNKDHVVALWRTEYVQYMNLRRLTQRGVPGLRVAGADEMPKIVDPSGRPVQ